MDEVIEIMETVTEYNEFYDPADLDLVVSIVSNNFFIIVAVILATYPFLYMFFRLLSYCSKAFDSEGIRQLEGGGLWAKFPTGSLYNGIEKIANIRLGEKWRLRKK